WQSLYEGRQRRRLPLPGYPFERERYWLDPPAETQPRHLSTRKKAQLTDWFYLPGWEHTLPPVSDASVLNESTNWLLFMDEAGLGERLESRLKAQGQQVVVVRPGTQFAQVADTAYCLAPSNPSDYDALCRVLQAADQWPRQIVHLWNVAQEPAGPASQTTYAFYSPLYLAQALDRARSTEDPVRLHLLANQVYAASDLEPVVAEKRLLCGSAKVLPQEFGWLSTQLVDVQLPPAG